MMKAIQVHQFVSDFTSINDSHMTMATNIPIPTIQKGQILVKVSACSISPGDVIMVHGNMVLMHKPFPFIPGMDICGTVVQEDPSGSSRFHKGDVIVASNGMSPVGGLAEYMAVNSHEAVLKPPTVGAAEAASCSSAITAYNAVRENVRPGDRVLVLGGSGGVGTAALQLAKTIGHASFVATTSTQDAFCRKLGADQVVHYKQDNWWEMKYDDNNNNNKDTTKVDGKEQQQQQQQQQPFFDVIIDCVGGGNYLGRAPNVLKSARAGGVFVAVTGDDPMPDCWTVWKVVQFACHMISRAVYYSRFWQSNVMPAYVALGPHNIPQGRAQVLQFMANGQLIIPMEQQQQQENHYYPFTDVGVRNAFSKIGTGHAHGKVVITME